MQNMIDPLTDLPLLAALSGERRAALLQHAVIHNVAPGTVLFEQGEQPNFQLVVLEGSVHLLGRSSSGEEALIEVVSPCGLIIPAAVLKQSPYLMRGRAPQACRLLMIEARAFRQAVASEPALALTIIGDLSEQFRRMVRQIKNLKLRSAKERTGCYLLGLAHQQGTPDRAVLPLEKRLLASELGMTRESLSRALSALSNEGITVQGEVILINDPQRLAEICRLDPLIDEPGLFPPRAD